MYNGCHRSVAQPGRVLALGARCRWSESSRSDQLNTKHQKWCFFLFFRRCVASDILIVIVCIVLNNNEQQKIEKNHIR